MDAVTLALAKSYTDSQRLAYEETSKKTLTWDGDADDVIADSALGPVVRLSDEYLDVKDIVGFTIKLHEGLGGQETFFPKGDNDTISEEEGIGFIEFGGTVDGATVIIASIPSGLGDEVYAGFGVPGEGIYAPVHSDLWFISAVHFETSTIHPIDPKFLPGGGGSSGGGFETVLLTTPIMSSVTEPQPLTADEGTQISAIVAKKNPFILSFLLDGELDAKIIMNVGYVGDFPAAIVGAMGTTSIMLVTEDGVSWFVVSS